MTQARTLLRMLGAPARSVLIALIKGYRATLSGWLGGQCRFFPSCSHYAEAAIRSQGALKGTGLAVWRVGRCNPFGRGGIDHAPGNRKYDLQHDRPHGRQYDVITHPTGGRGDRGTAA